MAVVRIKRLKVYLIIKITCFFCSRRKCTKMRSLRLLSPASRQKQEWKNVSRYWLIPHFLLQAALLKIALTTHHKTLDASQHDRPLLQPGPPFNTSAPWRQQQKTWCFKTDNSPRATVKALQRQVRTRNVSSNPTAGQGDQARDAVMPVGLLDHTWKT